MNDPHHHSLSAIESAHQHYIVTEDAYPLMLEWATQTGLTIPNATWFARNHQLLHTALNQVLNQGDNVVIADSLPYRYIASHLQSDTYRHFLGESDLNKSYQISYESIVSLDKAYFPSTSCEGFFSLEITRGVDRHGRDIGRQVRPYSLSLEKQIQKLKNSLSGLGYKVVLVDDGIWTGKTLELVINALREASFEIFGILVGLYVKKEGRVTDLKLSSDCKFLPVETYEPRSRPALDWVCERDFFLGIPFGGRTVFDDKLQNSFLPEDQKTIGAYYIEDDEWLKEWASINDVSGEFKHFCIKRSIALFEEIGRLSGRDVLLRDLSRIPLSLTQQNLNMTSTTVKEAFKALLT